MKALKKFYPLHEPHKLKLMHVLRYKILIPADFSEDTTRALEKARTIAQTIGAEIHLLHVVRKDAVHVAGSETGFPLLPDMQIPAEDNKGLQPKLLSEDINCIVSSVTHYSRRQATLQYIRENELDLALMGISRRNYFKRLTSQLFIRYIIKNAQIPVLGVNRADHAGLIKKIVIPLSSNIPLKALKMAAAMGKAFGSTIYLVGIAPLSGIIHHTMETTIEFIHSISNVKVHGYFLEGKNLIKGTLRFSKRIKADLVMIDPFKEFTLPGLLNKITRAILPDDKRNYIIVDN